MTFSNFINSLKLILSIFELSENRFCRIPMSQYSYECHFLCSSIIILVPVPGL
jgi:hypothetical protein